MLYAGDRRYSLNRPDLRGYHEQPRSSRSFQRCRPFALSGRDPQISASHARRRIHVRQAPQGAWRRRGRAPAGHQPSAPGRQDRHGLSRLWPAGVGDRLRRQCRPDAGGEALRSRQGLPARHLCDVVDPRRHPGICAEKLEHGEAGHHRGPEEAVLQSAQGQDPISAPSRKAISRPRTPPSWPTSWA